MSRICLLKNWGFTALIGGYSISCTEEHLVALLSKTAPFLRPHKGVSKYHTQTHKHNSSASILVLVSQWNDVSCVTLVVEGQGSSTDEYQLASRKPLSWLEPCASIHQQDSLLSLLWRVNRQNKPIFSSFQTKTQKEHDAHTIYSESRSTPDMSHIEYQSMSSCWNTSDGCNMSSNMFYDWGKSGFEKSCAAVYKYCTYSVWRLQKCEQHSDSDRILITWPYFLIW